MVNERMVTIQEIEKREKELEEIKKQAQALTKKPIPQRRFGAGVTPAEQREVIRQRREGERVLVQVSEQKKQLSEARGILRQQSAAGERVAAYERGRQLALRGRSPIGLETNLEREGYRQGRAERESRTARKDYFERIDQLKAEGLTPIIDDGKILGFEDEVLKMSIPIENIPSIVSESPEQLTRFEKLGIIERVPTQTQTLLPPSLTAKEQTFDFLFGEKGKKITGIGILGTPAFVTFQQIKDVTIKYSSEISKIIQYKPFSRPSPLKEDVGAFAIRTGAELIPTTPGEQIIIGGAVTSSLIFPPSAPIISGVFAYFGLKGIFDKDLTAEQRAASGIVAVAGGTGTIAGGIPYLRGIKARVSPDFRTIQKAPEGFKEIRGIDIFEFKKIETFKGVLEITPKEFSRIGLIPSKAPLEIGIGKEIKLPKISPLKRGGFGVKGSEKEIFLGLEQDLATSQRGLFRAGKDIPIERELFFTPQEPFIKIPITRISRLGLSEIFQKPIDLKLGVGIPEAAQIGITKAGVGRIETVKQLKIGPGSELEAIKTFGTITEVKRIGVTTIKGQGVDIFEFKISESISKDISKDIRKFRDISTEPIATVSTEGLISSLGISKTIKIPTLPTFKTIRTSPFSFPTTTPISPPIKTPKISPPFSPPVSPPFTPPRTPGIPSPPTITITPPGPPTPPKILPRLRQRERTKALTIPGFRPFVIKKGERFYLSSVLPKGKALRKAELEAKKTLRATFGVEPTDIRIRGTDIKFTPRRDLFRGYRIRKGKKIPLKDIYIQRQTKRLSFKGEVAEIHKARRIKL